MSKQKFPRYSKVYVCKEMPTYMSHFESDFYGIVNGTYNELYGGGDVDSYSLFVLDVAGKIVNSISWYEEDQLTLVNTDVKHNLKLISDYNNPQLR